MEKYVVRLSGFGMSLLLWIFKSDQDEGMCLRTLNIYFLDKITMTLKVGVFTSALFTEGIACFSTLIYNLHIYTE